MSALAFKVGDKVRVKSFDVIRSTFSMDPNGEIYSDKVYFTIAMQQYCEKEVKIIGMYHDVYSVAGVNGDIDWSFNDSMLESVDPIVEPIIISDNSFVEELL